jgi:hypothetical protein
VWSDWLNLNSAAAVFLQLPLLLREGGINDCSSAPFGEHAVGASSQRIYGYQFSVSSQPAAPPIICVLEEESTTEAGSISNFLSP